MTNRFKTLLPVNLRRYMKVLRILRLLKLTKLLRILRAGRLVRRLETSFSINYSAMQLYGFGATVGWCRLTPG
jgi:hypothetical protein